jgi:hypothetical protein
VFSGSDGISSKHHPSKMTSLEDMVMGSPLLVSSGHQFKNRTHPVKLADAEVLRSHEGRKSTSGLSSPSWLWGGSRLLDLGYISTWSEWKKDMTYQVIMGLGMVILSGDEQSLIKLPMADWAIAKVLLGICVRVLLVSVG